MLLLLLVVLYLHNSIIRFPLLKKINRKKSFYLMQSTVVVSILVLQQIYRDESVR